MGKSGHQFTSCIEIYKKWRLLQDKIENFEKCAELQNEELIESENDISNLIKKIMPISSFEKDLKLIVLWECGESSVSYSEYQSARSRADATLDAAQISEKLNNFWIRLANGDICSDNFTYRY